MSSINYFWLHVFWIFIISFSLLFSENKTHQDTVSTEDLIKKADGLFYLKVPSTSAPFTGTLVKHFDNGQIKEIEPILKGKWHGTHKGFYITGKKEYESNWIFGIQTGELTWSESGTLVAKAVFKDGRIDFESTQKVMTDLVSQIQTDLSLGNLDISIAFRNLASTYLESGRNEDAIKALENALENTTLGYGNDHPFVANSLSHIGVTYADLENHEEAIQFLEKALKLSLESLGSNNIETGLHHMNLAISFFDLREFENAARHLNSALEIFLEQEKRDFSQLFELRHLLGQSYLKLERVDAAIVELESALQFSKLKPNLGVDDLVGLQNHLGLAYGVTNEKRKAEEYFREALRMSLEKYGPNHPEMVTVYSNLGNFYRSQKNFSRALNFMHRGIEIIDGSRKNLSTSTLYNNLGLTYADKGEHFLAIKYLQLARIIAEEILGVEDPEIATYYGNLSSSYLNIGELKNAALFAHAQLDIIKELFGENHPRTGYAYNNLSNFFSSCGNGDKAVYYARKSLEAYEKRSVPNPQEIITASGNLAYGLCLNGDPEVGIKYAKKALEASADNFGENHFSSCHALQTTAMGEIIMGKMEEGISNYERALSISSSIIPPENPILSTLHHNLALSNYIRGTQTKALHHEVLANKTKKLMVQKTFKYLNPDEKLDFLNDNEPFAIMGSIGATAELAEAIMQWKGIVLDSLIEENLNSDANFNRLDNRDFLSNFLNGKNSSLGEDEEKRNSLRTFESDAFSVFNSLNKDSVLIELIKYRKWTKSKKFENEFCYGAMLYLKSKSDDNSAKLAHEWVELGPAKEVNDLILKFRSSIKRTGMGSKTLLSSIGRYLFLPMKNYIPDETKTLIICPDAELNFLPFPALIDEDGKFLCEMYEILSVSAGRDLVFESKTQTSSKEVILFADPSFDGKSATQEKALALREIDRNAMRDLSFALLPGTRVEAEQIIKMIAAKGFLANARTSLAATEESLRKVKSPKILHLATHGFFIPGEEKKENQNPFASFNKQNRPAGPASNPMHRSGLALAGAKNTLELWEEGKFVDPSNDGILTAEEASQLDLRGTWLTVLSACDTGSGVARAGEGVLGLRRAFAMAGTQNLLLTLWPVDDSFTKDFMVSFYKEALKTGNAPKAMAKVQKEWLIRLREERSVSQAVKLAGPFVLTFRGNPELN